MSDLIKDARLNIKDGRIHYFLYQQDGMEQKMDCEDTLSNRLCVSWMQAHDRYTEHGEAAD